MADFNRDLTQGSVTKQLIKFATPFLLSNLLQALYSVADMIIVGQFCGKSGLTGVSIGSQINILVTGAAMGFCADVAIATGGVGALAMASVAGGAINAAGNAINTMINGNEVTLESLAVDFAVGSFFTARTFGVGGGMLTKAPGKLWDNLCKGLFDSVWKHTSNQVLRHWKAKNLALLGTWLCKSLAEEVALCTVTSGGTVIFSEVIKNQLEPDE